MYLSPELISVYICISNSFSRKYGNKYFLTKVAFNFWQGGEDFLNLNGMSYANAITVVSASLSYFLCATQSMALHFAT